MERIALASITLTISVSLENESDVPVLTP